MASVQSGRSCEAQYNLTKSLDERKQTDVILLNFSKAFGRVSLTIITVILWYSRWHFILEIFLLEDFSKLAL